MIFFLFWDFLFSTTSLGTCPFLWFFKMTNFLLARQRTECCLLLHFHFIQGLFFIITSFHFSPNRLPPDRRFLQHSESLAFMLSSETYEVVHTQNWHANLSAAQHWKECHWSWNWKSELTCLRPKKILFRTMHNLPLSRRNIDAKVTICGDFVVIDVKSYANSYLFLTNVKVPEFLWDLYTGEVYA